MELIKGWFTLVVGGAVALGVVYGIPGYLFPSIFSSENLLLAPLQVFVLWTAGLSWT